MYERLAGIARTGHFVFESGYHGDTWLDLDALVGDAARLRDECDELAGRVRGWGADLVCGPLDGGAFVASHVAAALGVPFTYARRSPGPMYALAGGIAPAGRRVIVCDDAVNQGSATGATARELAAAGARTVGVAALLACRPDGPHVGERLGVPQAHLAEVDSRAWPAADCELCRTGVPLSTPPCG